MIDIWCFGLFSWYVTYTSGWLAASVNALCGYRENLGVEQIFKSNGLAFAHFWSKSDDSFFGWCKTVNIFQGKYLFRKYDEKYGIF